MKNLPLNNYSNKLLLLVFMVVIWACNITKHVPDDKYLLNHNTLRIEGKKFDKKEINSLFRQKPNKRILGIRFHLGLYNLSKGDSSKGIRKWFRKIGEEPVIYEEELKDRTAQQFALYLKNKGYYDYTLTDTVKFKNKTAHVFYYIKTGIPYKLQKISYRIEDTVISKLVLRDSTNCILKPGSLLDAEQGQAEKNRIESYLRNKGYYNFTKYDIVLEPDSFKTTHTANLEIIIRNSQQKDASGTINYIPHSTYKLGKVNVYIEKEKLTDIAGINLPDLENDTVCYNGICLSNLSRTKIKFQFLTNKIYLAPNQLYRERDVEETYKSLMALKIFKTVNIVFSEDSLTDTAGNKLVNSKIYLSTIKPQSYQLEPEITNSSGRLGLAGSVSYQNKNLFKGAENFSFRVNVAVEAVRALRDTSTSHYNPLNLKNTLEIGSEIKLQIPQFLLPFKNQTFIRRYNPSTSLSLSYRFLRRIEYIQSIANFTYGYNWNGNRYTSFQVAPFDINYVKLINHTDAFDVLINSEYAKFIYSDHLVTTSSVRYIYNNQRLKKNYPFYYLKFNGESAGSILKMVNNFFKGQHRRVVDTLFTVPFAQYLKADIDVSYSQPLNETDRLVYRVFIGVGKPYGNSRNLPFERSYFSGGANSIRAWPVMSLGPGSYKATSKYPEMVGDIKLETNFEYRFKFFWKLELALFLDAGNIWINNIYDTRKGVHFDYDRFYKEIAVGSGLGFRFDFSFFIARLDLGLKLRDPSLHSNPWTFNRRSSDQRTFVDFVNPTFGIGYPFN